ncbi:MAG: penicillin-binding protein 2, partial [Paludibacteraceae bacterium]|nr:penicillin-binding protein 2 [Paludibacteraceae bacterium]
MLNDTYQNRRTVIAGMILLVVFVYVARLFSIQILDDTYQDLADSNAFYKKVVYPTRGLIKDRNGKLIVSNKPAYDVMVVPRELKKLDTLDFCNTIGVTVDEFKKRMKELRYKAGYSSYTPQPFMTQLSAQDYGYLLEKL